MIVSLVLSVSYICCCDRQVEYLAKWIVLQPCKLSRLLVRLGLPYFRVQGHLAEVELD